MNNQRTIITIGMFDGVHCGHRHLLQQLDRLAEKLKMKPAVITFDEHPLTVIKPKQAPKLIETLENKEVLLDNCNSRKVMMLNTTPELLKLTAKEFIIGLKNYINVKAVLVGYNSTFGSDQIKDPEELAKELRSIGVDVYTATKYEEMEVSSSAIRKSLEQGDIDKAKEMLGRSIVIKGKVVKGQHIGNKLGFPTANLEVEKELIIPGLGVYAVYCLGYAAMLNIGTAPTIRKNGVVTVEVHIIKECLIDDSFDDYDIENLYGEELQLVVIKKIRDEIKFESKEELKKQLEKDREQAIEIVKEKIA